jgi:hypothetical protein
MVWLAEQGYLNFEDTIRAEALDQAVLSRRGFLLLTTRSELDFSRPGDPGSLPPSVAEQSQANINQLRAALREGSSIRLQQCVSYLLSQPPVGG